jgi:hypothetical protein
VCVLAIFHCYAQHIGWQNGDATTYRKPVPRFIKPVTIGFKTGSQFAFKNPYTSGHSYSQGMYLRSYINARIAVELGLNYAQGPMNYMVNRRCPGELSAPLSLQYFPCNPKHKLRPYAGAGVVYSNSLGRYPAPPYSDGPLQPMGLRRNMMNMILSQGMLYRINTKIQVNESIHIIPAPDDKTIGFDVGVGYSL